MSLAVCLHVYGAAHATYRIRISCAGWLKIHVFLNFAFSFQYDSHSKGNILHQMLFMSVRQFSHRHMCPMTNVEIKSITCLVVLTSVRHPEDVATQSENTWCFMRHLTTIPFSRDLTMPHLDLSHFAFFLFALWVASDIRLVPFWRACSEEFIVKIAKSQFFRFTISLLVNFFWV